MTCSRILIRMTEFDDMTKRILDKLDKIDDAIDSLCGRVMKVELDLENYFKRIERKQKSKDRKFYLVIACLSTIFIAVEILQNWS